MERAAQAQLSRGLYPYLSDPDQSRLTLKPEDSGQGANRGRARATNADWTWGEGTAAAATANAFENIATRNEAQGPAVILFIVGGVTFSEIRTVYETSRLSGKQCFIGGTSLMTPPFLLGKLKAMATTNPKDSKDAV